ncbi:MAG TPA: hypothetical protein VHA35_11290 [Dongiaceae bacterium]|nr:hypothetical protein [Dongiaceae bacterium]
MTGTEWLETTKAWIAGNKARLSKEGVDLASAVSEGVSVTVYAQTQSPDLFDDDASTEGFVELTARLTVRMSGGVELEILEAESGDAIESRSEAPAGLADLNALLEEFVRTLKSRSFPAARS